MYRVLINQRKRAGANIRNTRCGEHEKARQQDKLAHERGTLARKVWLAIQKDTSSTGERDREREGETWGGGR